MWLNLALHWVGRYDSNGYQGREIVEKKEQYALRR
jgi:hypothetical protein